MIIINAAVFDYRFKRFHSHWLDKSTDAQWFRFNRILQVEWWTCWRFQFNHRFDDAVALLFVIIIIIIGTLFYEWNNNRKQVFTVVKAKKLNELKTETKLKTLLKFQTNKPTKSSNKTKKTRITKHKQRWFSTPLDRKYHFVYGFLRLKYWFISKEI